MPTIWTPDNALFLTGVALTIAFLIVGEILEARRPRVTVRIVPRRRPTHRSPAPQPAAAPARAPETSAPWQPHDTAPEGSAVWRTSRLAATAVRQSAVD
jgi:hypothetical protein